MSGFELFWLILVIVVWIVAMILMVVALLRAGRPGDYRWMLAFFVAMLLTGGLGAAGSVMFG